MNIGLIIFAIIGSIIGLASTFYIVISMFWILGVKIVRRIISCKWNFDFSARQTAVMDIRIFRR